MDNNSKRIKLETTTTNVNNNIVNGPSANMFLTINDGHTSDSQEFLTIECNDLATAKHEQDVICTPTQTLPLQYRLVNQLQVQPNTPTKAISNVFPATMQLPSGCEIYLVNEYVEPLEDEVDSTIATNDLLGKKSFASTPTVKLMPGAARNSTGNRNVQVLQNKVPWIFASNKAAAGSVVECQVLNGDDNEKGKRGFLVEEYKKRDDKRRATHNEVERRRRDKINSWIFKLKELLPTDRINGPDGTPIGANDNNCDNVETVCTSVQIVKRNDGGNQQQQLYQRNTTNQSRTPPTESKSQILIKACEYIKSLQEEVNSLRKCLTENECLRLSNERLHQELNKLRNERLHKSVNNANAVVLESINHHNNMNTNGNYATSIATVESTQVIASGNTFSPYIKRELIIRDYVD